MTDVVIILVILVLLGGVAYLPIWWWFRKRVRALSLEELEQEAFRFDLEYFEFLGLSQESVIRFRNLVESQDLAALKVGWKEFAKDFRKLERKAGHKNRPLIFDYYGSHDEILSELVRRRAKSQQ